MDCTFFFLGVPLENEGDEDNEKDKKEVEENREPLLKKISEDDCEKSELPEEADQEDFQEEESALDDDLNEGDLQNDFTISYFLEENLFFAEQEAPFDYLKLSYGQAAEKSADYILQNEEREEGLDTFSDTKSDMITVEEAKKTFLEIQYAAVAGSSLNISSEKRRKFCLSIMFNPIMLKMFEALYAVTSEVNYSPLS